MFPKKVFKKIVFKTVVLFVDLVTIISMTAGPAFAGAPVATAVVTNSAIQVSFNEGVSTAPAPDNIAGTNTPYADDLRNYSLSVGGVNIPITRQSPFNLSTNYAPGSGATSTMAVEGLNLNVGDSFSLDISNIGSATTTPEIMAPSHTAGIVIAAPGPRLDSLSPMYGSSADNNISVIFAGANFPNATSTVEIQCNWENGGTATAAITTTSATSTVAVFDGTHLGTGTKNCNIRNTNTGLASASRRFYVYDPSLYGILFGSVKDVGGAGVDKANVVAYQPTAKWDQYQGLTQKDGGFAIPVPAGTYSIDVITPGSGSTGAAPVTTAGKVVTAGAATNVGPITFVNPDVAGHVTAGGAPVYGAQVRAHNMTWTVEQTAFTAYDGSYKMYILPSTSASLFALDVTSGDYYKNLPQHYLDAGGSVNVADSTLQVHDIVLPTPNVTGTVMTPLSYNAVSNPMNNRPMPGANIRISNTAGFERDAQTDSQGFFQFGGITGGTYALEMMAPSCDSHDSAYCMYVKTTRSITVLDSGVTQLASADTTFQMPNFFGSVVGDINGDHSSEAVANVNVSIGNPGFQSNTTTDASGHFAFYLPNTGTFQLQVPAPGYGLASFSAQVPVTDLVNGQSYSIVLTTPNVSGYVYGPLVSGDVAQPNTWVELCPLYGGTCYGSQTNNSGAFSINVADGTWTLSSRPNWDSAYIAPAPYTVSVVGGVLSFVQANQLPADTNPDSTEPWTTNGIIVRMVDPANDTLGLIGTVYGPTGGANATSTQANIQIGIRRATIDGSGNCISNEMSRWAQTNAQGNFAYSGVTDGVYEIEAMPTGNSDYSRTRICPATIGTGSRNLSIHLIAPNISGTVKTPLVSVGDSNSNPTPDTAVQNGWVSLQQENQQGSGGGWYGANSNNLGQFTIGGVPAGTYTLEVQAGWGGAYSSQRFQHIVIGPAGECVFNGSGDGSANDACDFNTLPGVGDGTAVRVGIPNIVGSVFDPTGTVPVPNAWVMVHNSDWQQNAGGNSDSNGAFHIGGLVNGTYQIEVNMPGGGSGQQAYTAPSGLAVTIAGGVGTITQDGNSLSTNNKILMSLPSKTISGTVKNNGVGVAHARVSANRDMGGGSFETTTDNSGAYTLKVSGGGWWLQVMPDFNGGQPDWIYSDPGKKVTFLDNENLEIQTVLFTVTASDSTITGLIKTPDGQAVQNVWVQLQGSKGIGSGGQTDNNGRFTIRIPAGTYSVNASAGSPEYGAPDQKSVTVASGQTSDAGTLYLKTKNAHIKGFVQDEAGSPMANVIVNANLTGGPGWAMTYTNATGAYDLGAWAGDWMVMVMPMSQSYIYQGVPKQVTLSESETSNNNNFQLKAADKTLKVSVHKQSDNSLVTDIWGGVWIKDTSANSMLDFGGPMNDMMEKSGMMSQGGGTGGSAMSGQGMQQGGFAGGALSNGYTEINVPAGTYQVGLGMPPGSKYTLAGAQTVTIGVSATSTAVTLLVGTNDKTVSGHFYQDTNGNGRYDSGEEVAVRGFVNADNGSGGWQMTESNSSNGSYSMQVTAGDWFVHGFIDSSMAFGGSQYMAINDNEKTTVGVDGATRDFQVKKLDATISGTVKNPDGTAMTSSYGTIWVFADFGSQDMIDQFNGPGGPGLGIFTNPDGTYELKVPAGTYKIGAGIPPWDTRDLLNPEPLTVTVAANATSSGNHLQFKASDATITGTITLNGSAQAGFVRAWSDSGKGSGTESADGIFTIKAIQGDTWHLVAAAKTNNSYYESPELTVATDDGQAQGTYSNKILALAFKDDVPDGVSSTFDASQSKTIKLTNGSVDQVVMDIPAGAIANSGTVTVSITPTVDVKPDSKDKPIGVAYDFEARDSDGNKIENFNQDITITIAYDPALIAAAGYTEDNITPKYYDTTTGSWENYSNVVRDTSNNKLIIKTDHFSSGGITGGDIPAAPSGLTATVAGSAVINLSWTDNSSNETGFKIYRNGSLIYTAAANVASYSDTGLTANTSYSYYIKATNDAGDSLATASASATVSQVSSGTAASTGSSGSSHSSGGGGNSTTAKTAKQEKPVTAMTQAEIVAQIVQIQAMIKTLQVQLAALTGQALVGGIPARFKFAAKLKTGMKSLDVQYLQSFLKSQGSDIYPEGLVTGYFGAKTAAAVTRFQEKYAAEILQPFGLMQGTGILGEKTTQKINSLMGI